MTFWTSGMMGVAGVRAEALPVFVAASSGSALNTNGLTVNKPSGVTEGMLLVAFCFGFGVSSAPSLSGWTLAYNGAASGTSSVTIFTKVAGSSEPSSYSFSGGPTGRANAHILAYTHGAVDVVGAKAESTGLTATAPSITATQNGILLCFFGVEYINKTVVTPPSGMVLRGTNDDNPTSMVYELSPSPVGATGDKTLIWTSGGGGSDTAPLAGISLQIY